MRRVSLLATTALGAALTIVAAAGASAGDKDQYTLFNPTPVDKMRDFSTDRPTKSNVPYTVDASHFQYEGDLFIYGYDNVSTADTNITSWTVGNPTLQARSCWTTSTSRSISPPTTAFRLRPRSAPASAATIPQGFGDAITRAKMQPVRQRGRRAGASR